MKQDHRIESLDILRGIALIGIIFFHSAIYNFANIHKIDFSDPPIIIVLISFMALWGGIFIIYSAIVNSFMALVRIREGASHNVFRNLVITGLVLLVWHYLLIIVLGRWNVDFVNNRPDLSMAAASLRNFSVSLPHINKYFEGSSVSTIAWNLIILAGILKLSFTPKNLKRESLVYITLGVLGTIIMVASVIRIPLFGLYTQALETNNYLGGAFFSFTLANPYPLLPYLAYSLWGAMIGLMISNGRRDLLKKIVLPAGLIILAYGIAGIAHFPKTISKPDIFWYFKTNFELGLFLLMTAGVYLGLENRTNILNRLTLVKYFSRVSLTVYMLETLVSEILRVMLSQIIPGWNQTINNCLAFGGFNVLVWILILLAWKKIDFKYSLEYFGVRWFTGLGKNSTKMNNLP